MRAITVYRWDDGRKTKDSIGVHIIIDLGHARRTTLPELTRHCSAG